jgi:class 3 adenylate cyclase
MVGELPSGTVTFLFSDIEGSTELSRRYGPDYGNLRAEHRRVLRDLVAAHQGRVLDTEGDAFFVVFTRAVDAVRAAIEVQQALLGGPVQVRIGIHTTEPHLHPEGYVGVGVSRAARICAAGHGGQTLLSSVAAGVIQDRDEADFRLRIWANID